MLPSLISRIFAVLLVLMCHGVAAPAQDLPALAGAALSGNVEAVQELRRTGPAGLQALLEKAAPQVAELRQNKVRLDAEESVKLRAAVDAVAGQRDAWASGLYWFTDLEAARAEAVKTGRPILSLRLLGNLDEEYCCANSRFFRTVLYANAAVSERLRNHYVLHWKSVRPAPLLTIDMGDGRRIKRTITGNSIHYLLDADGRVLEAFPGIYSPAGFMAALDAAWLGHPEKSADVARHRDNVIDYITNPPDYRLSTNPDDQRKIHGREGHWACIEWLGAAVQVGVYGESVRTAQLDPNRAPGLLLKLAKDAFPAGGFQQLEEPDVEPSFLLSRAQEIRFGKDLREALPVSVPSQAKLFSSKYPERIVAYPYPSEFDPPKAMVERPVLQETVPVVPVPEEKKLEIVREFPLPAEFDPPQIPKAMVERPILNKALPGNANEALDPASPAQPGGSLAGRMTPAVWAKIAEPVLAKVQLDEASLRFMMQKLPEEVMLPEEFLTGRPLHYNTAFGRLVERFQGAIARDMVRNEYYYHTLIHQWLEEDQDGSLAADVEALNRRVYQDLFLTPDYDAWLGLVPEDTYTAIEKDGCACDKGAPPMRQRK